MLPAIVPARHYLIAATNFFLMRPVRLTLLLALLPLVVGIGLNFFSPTPTHARLATRCTRYCYFHACPHATKANSPAYFWLRPVYAATKRGLSAGGRKWYVTVNVAVYLVLVPLLLTWLTYGVLRDARTIRRLKSHEHYG